MFHLSTQIGYGDHHLHEPHYILREQGTDCWLLEYVFEGQAWIESDEDYLTIETGDWVAFAPGARQHYAMHPAWKHAWLAFNPRPHWLDWMNWPAWTEGLYRLKIDSTPQRLECESLLNEGLGLKQRHWNRREDIFMNHIERILLFLDSINPNNHSALLDERIRIAVDYYCAQPETQISVESMAERCGLSTSRFAHLFKELIGFTPVKYQEKQRIRRARELLSMTRQPISQIAYACGYEDPLYFSRIFKKSEGVSPRHFRHLPSE